MHIYKGLDDTHYLVTLHQSESVSDFLNKMALQGIFFSSPQLQKQYNAGMASNQLSFLSEI